MTLGMTDYLRWYATYTPDTAALVVGDTAESYRTLWSRVCRLANAFIGLGIARGDRIAIFMRNRCEFIETYHAAACIGATVVPLNFRYLPNELAQVVNHAEASGLVYEHGLSDLVASARPSINTIRRYIETGSLVQEDALSFEALIAQSSESPPRGNGNPSDVYFQGYTSGTTGPPKGCVVTHETFLDCLLRIAALFEIADRDVELAAAPLFHESVAIFALTQLLRGGTVVLAEDFSPPKIYQAIQDRRVTWSFLVPTMWSTLVNDESRRHYETRSLRLLLSGGSPLLTATKDALLAAFPDAGLNEFYGATEMGLVTNLPPADQKRKTRSVGKPVPGYYIELRDSEGQSVAVGESGEIFVGGATLLREYFKNPQATEAARGLDGFLSLGDIGRFDSEGYLYIVDRKMDMIISGGENIFASDIEEILCSHPAVHLAAVVGAPDPNWGEIVVAAVTLRANGSATEDELIHHCKRFLSGFKVPKRIDLRPQLPLSTFGKVLRREVRRDYWRGHTVSV